MRTLISILLLAPVATYKIVLVVLGLIVVPLAFWKDRALPDIFRIGEGRPYTMWEAAIRNPVGGFGWLLPHPESHEIATYGEVREPSDILFMRGAKIKVPSFQMRFRHHFPLCSIRLLWIYPGRKHYGELYIGWKLNSAPPELDFALSPRLWAEVGN
jgi:hypothetical protein